MQMQIDVDAIQTHEDFRSLYNLHEALRTENPKLYNLYHNSFVRVFDVMEKILAKAR